MIRLITFAVLVALLSTPASAKTYTYQDRSPIIHIESGGKSITVRPTPSRYGHYAPRRSYSPRPSYSPRSPYSPYYVAPGYRSYYRPQFRYELYAPNPYYTPRQGYRRCDCR